MGEDLLERFIGFMALGMPVVAALHSMFWMERHWATLGTKLLLAAVLAGAGIWHHSERVYVDVSPIVFTLATLAGTAGVAELARLRWWQRPLLIVGGTLLVALPLWIMPVWKEHQRRSQPPATGMRVEAHQRWIAA